MVYSHTHTGAHTTYTRVLSAAIQELADDESSSACWDGV